MAKYCGLIYRQKDDTFRVEVPDLDLQVHPIRDLAHAPHIVHLCAVMHVAGVLAAGDALPAPVVLGDGEAAACGPGYVGHLDVEVPGE